MAFSEVDTGPHFVFHQETHFLSLWRYCDVKRTRERAFRALTAILPPAEEWVDEFQSRERKEQLSERAGEMTRPDDSFFKLLLYIVHFLFFFSLTDGDGLQGPAHLTAVRHSRSLLPSAYLQISSFYVLLKVHITQELFKECNNNNKNVHKIVGVKIGNFLMIWSNIDYLNCRYHKTYHDAVSFHLNLGYINQNTDSMYPFHTTVRGCLSEIQYRDAWHRMNE